MTDITRDLGRFVASLKFEQIPKDALEVIYTGFADCVGVMLAGAHEPPTRLLCEVLNPAVGPATLVFGPRTAQAPEAAWINGVAAHALDFDDVALKGHREGVQGGAVGAGQFGDAQVGPEALFQAGQGPVEAGEGLVVVGEDFIHVRIGFRHPQPQHAFQNQTGVGGGRGNHLSDAESRFDPRR